MGFLAAGSIHEIFGGRTFQPQELQERVEHKSAVLSQAGVRPADRVLLTHGNTFEFFCDLFAIWRLRATAVPVHPSLTERELSEVLELTSPRVVVTRDPRAVGSRRLLHTTDDFSAGAPSVSSEGPRDEDECLILFSSGSTGTPKGIRHSWGGLRFRIGQICEELASSSVQRALCFLPTSFGHGLIGNALAPLMAGGALHLLPEFNPFTAAQLPEMISRNNIDFFSSVPSVWKVLSRCSLPDAMPSLKRVHCASAPLSAGATGFIRDWCGSAEFFNVYGLTELGSWVAGSKWGADQPAGFVGRMWGSEVAIRQEDGRVSVRPYENGEILLKSKSFMLGLLGAEASEPVDGFFRTGDLGYLMETGELVLSGRMRDEINKGGMKVSPMEVRLKLEEFSEVAEAWVGPVDDELWGQAVGAMIVPKSDQPIDVQLLRARLTQSLASFKIPSVWKVVDVLPKLSNGKPHRKAILDMLSGKG